MSALRVGIMLPSRETAMTGRQELDEYLRAYYGQPLDVMHYVQAIRGGSVQECLDWLERYVDAGATYDPADRLAQRAPRIRGRETVARTEGA
jgi:hypothetical protein